MDEKTRMIPSSIVSLQRLHGQLGSGRVIKNGILKECNFACTAGSMFFTHKKCRLESCAHLVHQRGFFDKAFTAEVRKIKNMLTVLTVVVMMMMMTAMIMMTMRATRWRRRW